MALMHPGSRAISCTRTVMASMPPRVTGDRGQTASSISGVFAQKCIPPEGGAVGGCSESCRNCGNRPSYYSTPQAGEAQLEWAGPRAPVFGGHGTVHMSALAALRSESPNQPHLPVYLLIANFSPLFVPPLLALQGFQKLLHFRRHFRTPFLRDSRLEHSASYPRFETEAISWACQVLHSCALRIPHRPGSGFALEFTGPSEATPRSRGLTLCTQVH